MTRWQQVLAASSDETPPPLKTATQTPPVAGAQPAPSATNESAAARLRAQLLAGEDDSAEDTAAAQKALKPGSPIKTPRTLLVLGTGSSEPSKVGGRLFICLFMVACPNPAFFVWGGCHAYLSSIARGVPFGLVRQVHWNRPPGGCSWIVAKARMLDSS